MLHHTPMTIPQPDPHYRISKNNQTLTRYVRNLTKKGEILNTLIKGPKGSGKSTLPMQYAAIHKLPYVTIEVGLLSEASQVFGSLILEDGQTHYKEGLFTKAISIPGCVIHLQEINRIESDKTLNALFGVLDDQQRQVWIDETQKSYKVMEGVSFWATMNEGYDYVGTMPLDIALENRFHVHLTLEYPTAQDEAQILVSRTSIDHIQANVIVRLANNLRNNAQEPVDLSVRNTLEIARMRVNGIPFIDATMAAIGSEENKLESVLQSLAFSTEPSSEDRLDTDMILMLTP